MEIFGISRVNDGCLHLISDVFAPLRGSDAGFAHVSCIAEYAQRKTMEIIERGHDDGPDDYIKPWRQCPNCKQSYQPKVGKYLAVEYERFVESEYTELDYRRLMAYCMMLGYRYSSEDIYKEKEELIQKSSVLCDQLMNTKTEKNHLTMLNVVAQTMILIGLYYASRGEFYQEIELTKRGIEYLEKAKRVCQITGDQIQIARSETHVSHFKSQCQKWSSEYSKGQVGTKEESLTKQRLTYTSEVDKHGEIYTMHSGISLVYASRDANHIIEALRLGTKLLSISQQCHGKDHNMTSRLQNLLSRMTKISVRIKNLEGVFQALQYQGAGDRRCVVQGPVQTLRGTNTEYKIIVDADDIILPNEGVPVICHGLKGKASYLNGKIGDVRSYDESAMRYGVYFEDEDIPPKSVKLKNLRILFELPSEQGAK